MNGYRLLGWQQAMAAVSKAADKPVARRKRRKYATTARESLLDLVKRKGGATTKEITAQWKAEGRGGKADNLISIMVKAGELKRTPLKDQAGSRYTVA